MSNLHLDNEAEPGEVWIGVPIVPIKAYELLVLAYLMRLLVQLCSIGRVVIVDQLFVLVKEIDVVD